MGGSLQVIGIEGIPEVRPGDDPAELLLKAMEGSAVSLQSGDILVITQKIISKAEGRLIDLRDIDPSPFAHTIAAQTGKDARLVEVILRESRRVVKMDRGVLIVETHHGLVCANAGVDQSNVPGECVSLLPIDPDASAARLRRALKDRAGVEVAVIISDTFGRPWRQGLTEVAIGVSGLAPLLDYRGRRDRHGKVMQATVVAIADELACAAGLVCGKTEGLPVALIRGFAYRAADGAARWLIRPAEKDLFR